MKEPFCFPETEVEFEADIGHRSDQFIAVDKRVTVLLLLRRLPVFENLRGDPKIDLASIHQLAVIILPITFVVHGFPRSFFAAKSVNPCRFACKAIFTSY